MASANTLCKQLLGVKSAVVTGHDFYQDSDGVNHLRIHARPDKRHEDDCPFCHKRCRPYDVQTRLPRTWRALDWGGTLVEIQYRTHRILCPEHGVLVADVPWAYPGSGFTKDFDLTVGWLAVYLPRSTVSEYMRIDWETVGRCVHRTLNEIEPERSRRLDHLVNIGIDETSYPAAGLPAQNMRAAGDKKAKGALVEFAEDINHTTIPKEIPDKDGIWRILYKDRSEDMSALRQMK